MVRIRTIKYAENGKEMSEKREKITFMKIWKFLKTEVVCWWLDMKEPLRTHCFGIYYPPSFYYRHTPEEAKQIQEEQYESLRLFCQEQIEKARKRQAGSVEVPEVI